MTAIPGFDELSGRCDGFAIVYPLIFFRCHSLIVGMISCKDGECCKDGKCMKMPGNWNVYYIVENITACIVCKLQAQGKLTKF